MKRKNVTVVLLTALMLLCMVIPASAEVLERDANPVKMVLTDWGGVSMELQGQEKFFKAWDKASNAFVNLNVPKSNYNSFDVDGKNLAYLKVEGNYLQAYLFNIDTGVTTQISATYLSKKNIKIAGQYVAWQEIGSGIVLYDMRTNTTKLIASNFADDQQVTLSNRYLAYIDLNNGHRNIFLYDLQTEISSPVRSTINYKSSLALTDNYLVWAEIREGTGGTAVTGSYFDQLWGYIAKTNGVNDIWLYNINDGTTRQLTDSTFNKAQPAVWNNHVVWTDTEKGNPDIRMMDLDSGGVTNITNSETYDVQPEISNGYLAWISLRGNMGDLNIQAINGQAANGQTGSVVKEDIKVLVNGSRYFMDPGPYIKNERTMVPMRRIFEILGAQVIWNEQEMSVTAIRGSDTIKLNIGSTTAYKNGIPILLEAAPEIIPEVNRTMVPLRFVAEAIGCSVEWDNITRSVNINYGI